MAAIRMEDIAVYLKHLRFKKKVFGGVKEMDVWRKLEQLHQQYQNVFNVQKAMYEQKLEEKDFRIAQLEAQLMAVGANEDPLESDGESGEEN